jgi:hypothetical protein
MRSAAVGYDFRLRSHEKTAAYLFRVVFSTEICVSPFIGGPCAHRFRADQRVQNSSMASSPNHLPSGSPKTSPLVEIARVLVRLDHVASIIVNANDGIL